MGLGVTVVFMLLLAGLSFVGTMTAFSYEKVKRLEEEQEN